MSQGRDSLGAALDECVARVWREGFSQWWAELWHTYQPPEPPPPDKAFQRPEHPLPPEGMTRIGLSLHGTRRAARKSATEMKRRYLAGQPITDEAIAPPVEVLP